jgi:hypothetical protein
VNIILGGDSLFHKTKTPTSIPATRKGRRDVELSRGYDRMATPLGTLGLGLVFCLLMLCIVGFCSFLL